MTSEAFRIYALGAGNGRLGIGPCPGVGGYGADLRALLDWRPGLVLTMTEMAELRAFDAANLPRDLAAAGVAWRHLPIHDFGAPGVTTAALWPKVSASARDLLDQGGRIFIHCRGGCGRSGMAALRLLVELGEAGPDALARLRLTRPCAVETAAQMDWALRRD